MLSSFLPYQARILSESLPQVFGLDISMPTFNPFSTPHMPTTAGLQALLLRLPPPDLASVSADFYHRFMDSFFHPLHVPTFDRNTCRLRKIAQDGRWNEADLSFAATYFAVCALGAATMGEVSTVGSFTAAQDVPSLLTALHTCRL